VQIRLNFGEVASSFNVTCMIERDNDWPVITVQEVRSVSRMLGMLIKGGQCFIVAYVGTFFFNWQNERKDRSVLGRG
jgi:hypothetical protein